MRKILLLAAGTLLSVGLFAQAIAYSDNFESYTVGDYLAVQSTEWTTWSNNPGSGEDAFVSDEQALSGSQSVKVDGTSDLLLTLGNKVSGKWQVELNMYVPAGFNGYYNLQKYETPGTEWGVQAFFNSDGTGSIDAGAEGAVVFNYTPDTWINIVNIVDLDNDMAQVWMDGVMMVEWPWSLGTFGDPGAIQLGGMNLYAWAPTGEDPLYYFDDVLVMQLAAPFYEDNFDSYSVGDWIGIVQPDWWTTWSGAPGTPEDAYVSDNFANSPAQSLYVDPDDGLTDLILKLGDKVSGAYEVNWSMYVESGYNGYYNFQHFEAPGTEWAFEIWFYDGGNGELQVGGDIFTFAFPQDDWFTVEHDINIDADWASFYVNGVEVHSWPFSYESSGTGGTNQLGGVDYWTDDNTYRYYIDDVYYAPMPLGLYVDDFEDYTIGQYIAVVNPDWWTTWSGATGNDEDALITDDYAASGTQSVVANSTPGMTDLILKLGDRVSGAYDLNWNFYVETGFSGYYNIQHFEAPGTEWAFEVYFNDDGTGELYAGSATPFTFSYPLDTWFAVEHHINLDDDWIVLTIDGSEIYAWPFSWQSDEQTGTLQLGGVDFFTDSGMKFYFDDVEFIQTQGELDPVIAVTPDNVSATAAVGEVVTETVTVENAGAAPLEWDAIVIYPMGTTTAAASQTLTTNVRSLSANPAMADPNAQPATENPSNRDGVLNYDGDNFSAIGWATPPVTVTVAAKFIPEMTLPLAGQEITSVDVYINDLNAGTNDMMLKIYDMGTSYAPGALLYEQAFTPMALSWNNIVLNDPVYISGADIWVGYQFTQTDASIFIPGTDAGPADPNGDFISTGVGWSHLSSNPELDYNWNIRANVTGSAMFQWLTVAPETGTIEPGMTEDVILTMDATGLAEGTYQAIVRFLSNDPETPQVDVPVTFTVTPGTPGQLWLNFEDQADFSLTFDPWMVVDNDGGNTYGITDVTFPHAGEPMAYIAFNPDMTTPPMTDDPAIQPYEGERFGACFSSVPPATNDDWLISPQFNPGLNPVLNFWVKSYTDDWGLELYNVGVSTTGTAPEDFTIISGPEPLEAPVEAWTQMEFDLSAYIGQDIYVAINCVSTDMFIFMVDDIVVDWSVDVPEIPADEARIALFPNPADDQLFIISENNIDEVEIYNYVGQVVYSSVVKNNELNLDVSNLNAGMYIVRIKAGDQLTTRKVLIK